MKKIIQFSLAAILLTSFFSCKKDKTETTNTVNGLYTNGVFILNEGLMGSSNSSLDFYSNNTNTLTESITNSTLGDVGQSLLVKDSLLFVVVNNSGKIQVYTKDSMKLFKTITGLTSPRYLAAKDSLLIVSDLSSKKISVVNYFTGNVVKTISVNGWTEQIQSDGTNAFIEIKKPWGVTGITVGLLVFNWNSLSITTTIPFNSDPNGTIFNKNEIYSITSGDSAAGIYPTIEKVNLSTLTKTTWHTFSSYLKPNKLTADAAGNLYFISNNIYRIDYNTKNLQSIIPSNGRIFYSLKMNAAKNYLYTSDAIDYVQKGTVYVFDNSGNEIKNFKAGINPTDYVFAD